MTLQEVNLDGLVGPTHNYAGLSPGNLASSKSEGQRSNPQAAALQGLQKMRFVHSLGVPQGALPPHERPLLPLFHRLGFAGTDENVLAQVAKTAPQLLRIGSSASAMWTANAATVAPSSDTDDGRVHIVPANLSAMPHRALEADTTTRVLRAMFASPAHFCVHDPLPGSPLFSDEGAANHTRLSTDRTSLHLFGYGRADHRPDPEGPTREPARQSAVASRAVSRLLRLDPDDVVLWRQHPAGIDAGAFHSDVLAVGTGGVLLVHELAFADADRLFACLRQALGDALEVIVAPSAELPVADAVSAYPFNSQLLPTPTGLHIVAPTETRDNAAAHSFLQRAQKTSAAITAVHYREVNESMNNGGGPPASVCACP